MLKTLNEPYHIALEDAQGAPGHQPHAWEPHDAFHAIFENAPFGMLVATSDGLIAAVSARLLEMFGYAREELVGKKIEMLLPPRNREAHVSQRTAYAVERGTRAMGAGRDLTGLRKDGLEFPLEIGLSTVETPLGVMCCATIVDITERKRGELKLREANARLEEFSYVASHDLRSPIRGIASLVEFLREDLGEDIGLDLSRHLDRMSERVEMVDKLIADLLAYARAGKGERRSDTVSLARLVPAIVELESPPASYTIDINVPEETFIASETAIATVLRNLISNAIRHHDRDGGEVTVRGHFTGSTCVIEVADDGPGIPEAAQERVFRLFQRLGTRDSGGTGLGLALVRRLVEGHGGSITLISRDGERGTTFRVAWPRFARTDHDD